MPISRSFRRVRLMWLLRALALSCCVACISSAMCSISAGEARPLSHHDCTSPPTAVWTCRTVNSGFFPPKLLMDLGKEQMADRGQHQVAFQARVPPALVVVQPQLAFLILKTAFHTPSREADQQQRFHLRFRRRVADEELDLVRFQYIPSDDQMIRLNQVTQAAPHACYVSI